MVRFRFIRTIPFSGGFLLLLLLFATSMQSIQASAASTASQQHTGIGSQTFHSNVQQLHSQIQKGNLAPSVHVLHSLSPTINILQFPLVPSGIKAAFPQATGLVTIMGDRSNSTADTVTVDVQHMPPNITFTIFLIEIANKPFGNVEYVADLTTRGDGSGESVFQVITQVAFAMDARNPGSSQDKTDGLTSGINLEHMGMWFSSLQDAQKVLNNDSLKGTIFDGGNPPLHAGPQAMTDGQSAPVF